jgi:hypothetical protein
VGIEPVSTIKFPANREINREFCRFGALLNDFSSQSTSEFSGLQLNSLRKETRNIWRSNREFLESEQSRSLLLTSTAPTARRCDRPFTSKHSAVTIGLGSGPDPPTCSAGPPGGDRLAGIRTADCGRRHRDAAFLCVGLVSSADFRLWAASRTARATRAHKSMLSFAILSDGSGALKSCQSINTSGRRPICRPPQQLFKSLQNGSG